MQHGEDFKITDADVSKYSYWRSKIRTIPMDIVLIYEEDDDFVFMEKDLKEKIISNLRSTIGDDYALNFMLPFA
jgi:hypothetical protein